ncbi:uncharacterized protein VTP21DRAFT_6349 [Calcarisporiella thermophila]|uniref:uncharacterized protein n=1 Tax=Calcarisporiella thermophila TaxID=911321 RepID=UPI003743A12C
MSLAGPITINTHLTPAKRHFAEALSPSFIPEDTSAFPPVLPLSVQDALRLQLRATDDADAGDAFFVADLGEVLRQDRKWKQLLPRIEPFYAVKCNPDPAVLRLMAALGNGFDCASKGEIEQVLEMGVPASRIIYANPCKQVSFLRYAREQGIGMMTFDNADELRKVAAHYPDVELVIRVLADDSKSVCQLGTKFGAPAEKSRELLELAKELGLRVVGVSFHVGSGCFDEGAFADAVQRARRVFTEAEQCGFQCSLLDVGGGFPGANVRDGITFERVAAVLRDAIQDIPHSVRIIGEPGRYYVASAFTLATQVIARRQTSDQDMYYINDGVYGSFNCIIFDHQKVQPSVLQRSGEFALNRSQGDPDDEQGQRGSEKKCSVWGPTCDSIDCVMRDANLPTMDVGDWLAWENMGAYTSCAASTFNGFRKTRVVYTALEWA